jgi:hypothetical protein
MEEGEDLERPLVIVFVALETGLARKLGAMDGVYHALRSLEAGCRESVTI